MRRLALAAIRVYQRWISPHKGFCCALRAHTGGDSCSAYGHLVIARFGLRRGLGLLDRRLALCGHVHRTYTPARPAANVRNPWRHKEQGHCDVPCDSNCDIPCDCAMDVWDCGRTVRRAEDDAHARAALNAQARRIAKKNERPPPTSN